MTTPFLLLIEGGKLLAIANNFFPELGGLWRQGETVSHTLHHFEAVSGTPGCCSSGPARRPPLPA